MVPKKNNKWRMVTDYRKINLQTEDDVYQAKRISSILLSRPQLGFLKYSVVKEKCLIHRNDYPWKRDLCIEGLTIWTESFSYRISETIEICFREEIEAGICLSKDQIIGNSEYYYIHITRYINTSSFFLLDKN
eukprot:GHVP01056925.1.p2 GENE.GHVP01056925.1~~GHVP01056925.1.p2  ORF type:complete len:133 (-),score=14.82 GHVP01056925.1:792-1190(-)